LPERYDKRPAMNIGLLFSIMAGLMFIVLVIFKDSIASQPIYFFPYALIAGFGTGALFTIPLSMVADTIDFDEYKRGLRFEGFYFGSLTLYYKLSQAVAIFVIGILLDIIRFDSSLPTQSEFTLISLGMILALGSIFSFILAYFSLRRYPLNEERVRHIQSQIRKMQQE
jgi:glycoside/pentoside/hexuronide:cation symporter, GPH family